MSIVEVVEDEAGATLLELEQFEAADGFGARWLDRAELRAREPRLAGPPDRRTRLDGNGVVDSHLFTVLLAEAAQARCDDDRRDGPGLKAAVVGWARVVLEDRAVDATRWWWRSAHGPARLGPGSGHRAGGAAQGRDLAAGAGGEQPADDVVQPRLALRSCRRAGVAGLDPGAAGV